MDRPLTTTSHAVLGLLAIRPWTTYELAKQVQRSLGWFWPRAERKLYDEPKRLVAAGFATATAEATGKRPRTVYAITDAGRAALRSWLDGASAPPTLEFEAMVKVFFADGGSLAQLRATLAGIEAEARDRQAVLQAMADAAVEAGDGAPFAERAGLNALVLRFSIDHEDLVARWAAWAGEQVAGWRAPTDVRRWDAAAALAAR